MFNIVRALQRFRSTEGGMRGAAIACYSLLALAPLAVLLLQLGGLFLGDQPSTPILDSVSRFAGEQGRELVTDLLDLLPKSAGTFTSALSMVLLLYFASNALRELRSGLDSILGFREASGIRAALRLRLTALALVFLLLALLLASMLLSLLITALRIPSVQLLSALLSLTLLSAILATLYRYVPVQLLTWRKALRGGIFTAALYLLGNNLVGALIARSPLLELYGTAGTIIALLLWLLYSSQVLLFGAAVAKG